jgi:hypothetical protein
LDSDLPILRYIFVHHVREFPFLDKAKEKEFWQDKLQVVSLPYYPNKIGNGGVNGMGSFYNHLRARTFPPPKIDWKKRSAGSFL